MIRIEINADSFLRFIESQAKQVRYAAAVALTQTAKAAAQAENEEIGRVFDRPRPTTVKAVEFIGARKSNLIAVVRIKDAVGKGNAPDKYLRAEILGGPRRAKRSGRAIRLTYPWLSGYWVPGDAMKLDANGNIPGATIVRILADIKAAETKAGYAANRTRRSTKRYTGERYFVPPPGSKLDAIAPGVWVRRGGRYRSMVAPALIFVASTNYRQRFDFFGKGEEFVRQRLPVEFEKALAEAFATAR